MNSLVKWRPNPRVQPTPLAASKIVRFLKAGFGPKRVSIYEAARLTRNTFGRDASYRAPYRCLNQHHRTYRHQRASAREVTLAVPIAFDTAEDSPPFARTAHRRTKRALLNL